ncbi:hypothetical protein G9F72_007145 [Clostridium estertheticum]|uniref:hypothetical protein n=1 Tax=Clostridium estertheticum TaxID=238834 RepID=UPI0013E8FB17|nr:hypothetical protein [Clostridium estertheticum]MBZ9686107.1 hypothetical protein [Clostridium estertheticum]
MFKLIKYELRSTALTILGICITVIVANLLLMTKKGSWDVAVPGLSICLTIGAIIVIFIASLKIMSKYLHGDEGYLLFTLPQSGTSILTSRLITALIQISIVIFVSLLMFYLIVPEEINLSFFKALTVSQILFSIIAYIWSIVSSLTFIYFCMVIGKVAFKGKKLGKIGSFIIFMLISIAISWLSFKIVALFPQTLNLGDSSIANNFTSSNSSVQTFGGEFNINIASAIFDIITFVGFFITTTYLIDKKLDLS